MADVTKSERIGKRVKHKYKEHYVGGGIFGGSRKVGTSYEVEMLPEDMREDPEEAEEEISHRQAIRNLRNFYGIPSTYIHETKRDIYNKGLCPKCERKLSKQICKSFAKSIWDQARKHLDLCCPECGEWLDGFENINVVNDKGIIRFDDDEEQSIPPVEETYDEKVKAKPCGCIMDEKKYFFHADVPENNRTAKERLEKVLE